MVPLLGSLEATGDLFEPFRLVDAGGVVVAPAGAYFRELAAAAGDAPVVWDGCSSMVPVPVGGGGLLGSGDQC